MNLGTAVVLLIIVAWLAFLLYRYIKKKREKRALLNAGTTVPVCSGSCSGCSMSDPSCSGCSPAASMESLHSFESENRQVENK